MERNSGVDQILDSHYKNKITEIRNKLKKILTLLLFCALHKLPIRGNNDNTAVFNNLPKFRINAGDLVLKSHLEKSSKNALYISYRVKNELIECASYTLSL
ncbi:unnamed protein product [Macrosiphum euphorbiae]|uniref:Uncharacterized protein n=1 Tax=Macrosiphum euphorbiae TaxID=13131 RepID=A0AAV0W316_9HEMI|nr:unnamed protein product [Macrosiphum euphorbiae]